MPFEVFNSVPEDQRPKRPALFMEDTFDGKTMGDIWADIGKKYGYEMVLRESMGMGGKDFTSQVMKGKEANIDAILCMANVPETVTLVRQLKENKVNIKWFQGFKGTWSNDFWEALGSDAEGPCQFLKRYDRLPVGTGIQAGHHGPVAVHECCFGAG